MPTYYKVLVTGSTGFVGSNLVRRLYSEGHEVHIITRESSNKWRIRDILPNLNEHVVDLLDGSRLKVLLEQINPDVIFHLATLGIHGGIQSPDKEVIETNLFGTMNLINACNNIEYRCFVNTGSSSEYGPKKELMNENDVCEPINVYGISKCAATLYGNLIAKTLKKPIIGFRLFSPFGPYDDKRRLMAYAITNALQNKPLMLANPNAVRDYIYIDDVLDLYLQSIELASGMKGEVFNIGSGSEKSVSYVVNKIIEMTNSNSEIKWNSLPKREYDTEKWEADIEKVSKYYKWDPNYRIDEGIIKSISWFKSNLSYYV